MWSAAWLSVCCVFDFQRLDSGVGQLVWCRCHHGLGLSGRLDGIVWMVTEALGVSITTFSAQNFGARNYERMRKGYHTSLVLSFMLIGGLSAVLLVFSGPLSRLFVDDASISAYTTTIIHFIAPFYAIFSIIENASGSIRGAGVSLQPMILTIFGTSCSG